MLTALTLTGEGDGESEERQNMNKNMNTKTCENQPVNMGDTNKNLPQQGSGSARKAIHEGAGKELRGEQWLRLMTRSEEDHSIILRKLIGYLENAEDNRKLTGALEPTDLLNFIYRQ